MAHIVVIEDDEHVRDVITRVLTSASHRVTDGFGRDLGELLSRDRPDLVILDMLMPLRDGVEILRDLHVRESTVKVLAISGGGRMPGDIFLKIATGMGAADTLDKPFRREQLLEKVNGLLTRE